MRTFLGGIGRQLMNWHYYPKNFNILINKNDFMINSMVKSITSPCIAIEDKYIQLEEQYIDFFKNKKVFLELLDRDQHFSKNKLRDNYPEYFYLEKEIYSVESNKCDKVDTIVKEYLKNIKKIKIDKVNIDIIKLENGILENELGLCVKLD